MENNETFKMTYSAEQQEEVEAIRKKYLPKEENKMAKLRTLDASAEKKATKMAIIIGVIGSLILGIGMSLVMTDFGAGLGAAAFVLGIIIGVIGLGVLGVTYPVYNSTLKKERERIAPEVLKLTEELMK